MAQIEEKPTIDEIKDKFSAYERYYGRLHQDQKDIDDYYELTFDPGVPAEYPVRMPDTARSWVDAGVRHYTLDNPRTKFFQRNNSDAARNQVALLETFGNFFLRLYIQTIKEAAKKLLLRGEVFIEVGMDDTYLGEDNDERLYHFPLTMNVLDPINTYCSPAHSGLVPRDIIRSFKITVAEARAICEENNWDWTPDKEDDKLVTWFSYKSPQWRCFMIDDDPVLPDEVQPNILGFTNVVHINAGVGQSSYEGKPEYLYRSIIWPRKDMLKLEARNLSQMDAILARYAWARYKATLGRANTDIIKQLYPDGKVPTDPSKWLFDVANELTTEIIKGEDPPMGLFNQLAMIREYSSPPAVLSGMRPTGVYSGQHQETLLSTAKPIYKDPFKNLEDGLAVNVGMGLKILEKVYNYPVQLKNLSDPDVKGYLRLTPKDINGHYDCEVELLAEPPEATDARKYLGANLRKGGSISERTELKEYHDMSEKEMMDEMAQKYAERGLNSMGVLDAIAKDAMQRLGMEKELELLEQAQANAAKNIPPPKEGEGVPQQEPRTRGRITPGVEPSTTPREVEMAGRLAE